MNSESSAKSVRPKIPWLFDAVTDLSMFAGSAAVALLLLAVGHQFQWLSNDTPDWLWIAAVLLIDVAHVYATGFRVYFDRHERQRRPWLYLLTPLLAFVLGAAVHSEDARLFWRLLAYLAVFHFVRQQYGWVALYRAKAGEETHAGRWIDSSAIYLATLYPLARWHAALPRRFHWFQEGDFVPLPSMLADLMEPLYWTALAVYAARSLWLAFVFQQYNPGKDLVVVTTAVCWYVGIVAMDSDYAFTVTNVIIHGVPYLVLVYRLQPSKLIAESEVRPRRFGIVTFLAIVWTLAFFEELLWDNGVWQERSWLFGSFKALSDVEWIIVPLLAVPQVTHYILDGFIWKRRQHQDLEDIVTR
jgi:hypothetical protein